MVARHGDRHHVGGLLDGGEHELVKLVGVRDEFIEWLILTMNGILWAYLRATETRTPMWRRRHCSALRAARA